MNNPTKNALILVTVISALAGCVTTRADKEMKSAWLYYGASETIWIADHGTAQSFEREASLRRELAKAWAAQKKLNKEAQDRDLDQLLSVVQAGFVNEYVWTCLARPEWKKPEGMDLPRFELWRIQNLKNHNPGEPRDLFRTVDSASGKEG